MLRDCPSLAEGGPSNRPRNYRIPQGHVDDSLLRGDPRSAGNIWCPSSGSTTGGATPSIESSGMRDTAL